jgi:hypothetical protein
MLESVLDVLLHHPHIGTRTSEPIIRRMTVLPYPYLIFYEATIVAELRGWLTMLRAYRG